MRTLTQSSPLLESSNPLTSSTASRTASRTANMEHSSTVSSPAGAAERARHALLAAIGQKAYDVRALHVGQVSDIADYFIVASGTSDRHVKGIADKIKDALRELPSSSNSGESPPSVSGYESAEWIILDYGDIVVHVFYEPARQYYDFDRLWNHAPPMELPDELETQAKRLRTGMVQFSPS